MASRGKALSVAYVAWDTNANSGKTGDVANHTLRWIKDGSSAAPTNAPTEVDATNAPGVYQVLLTDAECTCSLGVLSGKSATSGVVLIPVSLAFEQLPAASLLILQGILDATESGTVSDASATAVSFVTSLTQAATDFYKGAFLVFTSGSLAKESRAISAYNGSTKAVTLYSGFTAAPGNGDHFLILGRGIL